MSDVSIYRMDQETLKSHENLNLINRLIHDNGWFAVWSDSKSPKLNAFNQDYSYTKLYLTRKQGDYIAPIIMPAYSETKWHDIQQDVYNYMFKYLRQHPFTKLSLKDFYTQHESINRMDNIKIFLDDMLAKLPLFFITNLTLLLNVNELNGTKNQLNSSLPIRISTTTIDMPIKPIYKLSKDQLYEFDDRNNVLWVQPRFFTKLINKVYSKKYNLKSITKFEPRFSSFYLTKHQSNLTYLLSHERYYSYSLLQLNVSDSQLETWLIDRLAALILGHLDKEELFLNANDNPLLYTNATNHFIDHVNVSDLIQIDTDNIDFENAQLKRLHPTYTFMSLLTSTVDTKIPLLYNDDNFYAIHHLFFDSGWDITTNSGIKLIEKNSIEKS